MMLHPSRKEGGTGGMTRPLSFQTTDLPPSTPGCVILATSFLSLRVFTVFILAPFFGGKTNTSEILSSEGFRLSWFLIPLAMVGTLRDVEKYIVFWKTQSSKNPNKHYTGFSRGIFIYHALTIKRQLQKYWKMTLLSHVYGSFHFCG